MLTVRYDWLGLGAGDRVLDLGCGAGRHAFEAYRRGARVTALDYDAAELKDVMAMFGALSDDEAAIAELARVLRPGGTMAVTVPAWLAERVCWALTDEYHAPHVPGGHVRIYSEPELRAKLRRARLRPGAAHHAHALHTPYWWLKCAVGPTNSEHPLVRAYHEVLLWDIVGRQPMARFTKLVDRLANPLLGKSLVVYARKEAR